MQEGTYEDHIDINLAISCRDELHVFDRFEHSFDHFKKWIRHDLICTFSVNHFVVLRTNEHFCYKISEAIFFNLDFFQTFEILSFHF